MAYIKRLDRSYVKQGQRFWQCSLTCGHFQWVHGMKAVEGYFVNCNDCAEANMHKRNQAYRRDEKQLPLFSGLPLQGIKHT